MTMTDDGAVLLGKVPTNATYDPPAKYKGRRNAKGQLVGTRIDPNTPLGDQLAKLRLAWKAGARIGEASRLEQEDTARRLLEGSLNVPVDPNAQAAAQWRAQRRKVIRKRIMDVIDQAIDAHGRPPTTIGIPAETIDEVREACCDFDVTFVVQG